MSNVYQVLSERIYSDFPIFGSCIRQRAAVALSKDKSPQAVRILAEAVVRSGDRKVITIALEALRNLRDRDSVNAFCQVWAESRHKDLTTILKNRRYISTEPKFLVLSALKVGALDLVKRGDVSILEPLLAAISDKDTQIASAASVCLVELQDRKVIDALCKRWIENPSSQLQNAIQKVGYEPEDAISKALFYFLLGEWQKYEDLDFDQSLLAKAYQLATQKLKGRISEKARTGGRIELIKIMTGSKRVFDAERMTNQDWETFIDILEVQPDKKEILNFLYNAPIIWSKQLLDRLDKNLSNYIFKEDITARDLFDLAKKSNIQDLNLLPYLLIQSHYKMLEKGFSNRLAISHNGNLLISSEIHGAICIWSLPDCNQLKIIEVGSNLEIVEALVISPDNQILASACGKTIHLSSLPDGSHIKTIAVNTSVIVTALTISPNNLILASSDDNGEINIWNLPDGSHMKTLTKQNSRIDYLSITPDNQCLVSADMEQTIILWNLLDGNVIQGIVGGKSFCMSPDGRFIASSGLWWYKTMRLWSLPEMEHLNTLEVNHYGIKPLAISPDGRLLISGSSGSAETREYSYIDVWSLPNGNHLTNITIRVRGIKSAVISPDSRVLIIGDTAGNIRFWDLSNKDITINDFTPKNIIDLESKINTSSIEESLRDALKFTLALIRLRQQFDIDIEDSSNDIQFSEFDIEIEG